MVHSYLQCLLELVFLGTRSPTFNALGDDRSTSAWRSRISSMPLPLCPVTQRKAVRLSSCLSTGEVSKLWLTNVYPVDIYWISRYLVVPWFCSWVVWSCLHESCFARTFPREAIQHCRNLDGQCLSSTRCLPEGLEQSSDLLFCGAASCCYSLYPRLWFLNIGHCRLHLFHIVFLERQHFITEHCIILAPFAEFFAAITSNSSHIGKWVARN